MDNTTPTNNNYIIAGAIIVAGIVIALGIFASKNPVPLQGNNENNSQEVIIDGNFSIPEVNQNDHIRGNIDAKIVMVEYSDIQCPFCQQFHTEAKSAQQALSPNEFAWVYRHFPLSSIHPHATRYALATECVASQKGSAGFALFIDALIEKAQTEENNPEGISESDIIALASSQGVDTKAFTTCLSSDAPSKIVSQHTSDAMSAGATGTPFNIFVLKEALSDKQREALKTAFPQPGLFTLSEDGKKLSMSGSIGKDQIIQIVNILLNK